MPDETNIQEQFTQLQQEFDAAKAALRETRQALDAAEQRHRIDRELLEAETIDLAAARLLTEAAVAQMDEADVKLAVDDLRANKPYLFRRRRYIAPGMPGVGAGVGVMAPRTKPRPEADQAAEQAAISGDRRDLLRYLRLRRKQA